MPSPSPSFVRYVRYPVRYPVRCQTRMDIGLCGMCGIRPYVGGRAGARVCRRVHVRARRHAAHAAHTAHALRINHLRASAYRTPYPTYRTEKMMDEKTVDRVIHCTPENFPEFGAAVARWPALQALAKDLHAQGFIQGLRDVQITLSGSPEWVGKGLDAVDFKTVPNGQKTDLAGS